MKHTLLAMAFLLGATTLCQAAKVSFPDVPAAKEKAKAEKKPALILWYGSDWMPRSADLCKNWETFSKSGLPVVFGQFDEHLGLNGDVRKKTLPIEHYNLPAAILLAPDGSFMAEFSGSAIKNLDKLKTSVEKLIPKAEAFSQLAEQARTTAGPDGAKAAGQALELVPLASAMKNRELIRIINNKDPEDTTGYRSLFALEHMGMYREIGIRLQGGPDGKLKGADRDFDAAEKYVRNIIDRKLVKGERLQQWKSGLAYITKERICSKKGERNMQPLVDMYTDIAKIDPKSQYGRGAAKLARYWDPKVYYEIKDFYTSGDQTLGFEKEWHVNVSKSIKGSGIYTFSLIPTDNGGMVTRNYRLAVNGKVVAKANIDPDKNTKTVDLAVPAIPKGKAKVEVWLTARCNDGWFGCQGFIEMKKKAQ